MNLFVVERILKREQAKVTLAADGRQALQILKAQPRGFDVVLMDIQMPAMDGLTATRAIRADPELAGLPVIALTAGVLDDEREAALAAGVDAIVAKPLDVSQLAAVLSSLPRARPAG
jgi:CheY-like chemotaxis protein